jgi:type IV pilus modification protein PilV
MLPAGFTLVEILVSLMVLAVGCLGALSLQASAMQGGSRADRLTVASFLAESQIELLRSMDFNAVPVSISSKPEYLGRDSKRCKAVVIEKCYIRTTSLILKQPTTRSHQITVSVTPPEANNALVYHTIISDYGF